MPEPRFTDAAFDDPDDLAERWLAALPAIHARLAAANARVLDLGCGQGWWSVALAEAFPVIRVDGVDLDEPLAGAGPPPRAARGCRRPGLVQHRRRRGRLADVGAVLIADDKVAEVFTARLNDAVSITHCVPATRAEGAVEEASMVRRPNTVRRFAERTGFDRVKVVPIAHDRLRLSRLGAR